MPSEHAAGPADLRSFGHRLDDVKHQCERNHDKVTKDVERERSRVDDVVDDVKTGAVELAKINTTLKILGGIIVLVYPSITAVGVYLVMQSFAAKTVPVPQPAAQQAMIHNGPTIATQR